MAESSPSRQRGKRRKTPEYRKQPIGKRRSERSPTVGAAEYMQQKGYPHSSKFVTPRCVPDNSHRDSRDHDQEYRNSDLAERRDYLPIMGTKMPRDSIRPTEKSGVTLRQFPHYRIENSLTRQAEYLSVQVMNSAGNCRKTRSPFYPYHFCYG